MSMSGKMKLVKTGTASEESATGELYLGNITAALLAGAPHTEQVEIYTVAFAPGARNRVHIHRHDQVLLATAGRGIIADESGEHVMEPGDIVTIPAGHPHWHGATEDSAFTHVTIARPGDEIEIVDQDDRGAWGALS